MSEIDYTEEIVEKCIKCDVLPYFPIDLSSYTGVGLDIYTGEFFNFDVRDSLTNEQISNFEIKIYKKSYPNAVFETLNSERTITGTGNYRKYTNGTYVYTIKSDGYDDFSGEFKIYSSSDDIKTKFNLELIAVNKTNLYGQAYDADFKHIYDDNYIGCKNKSRGEYVRDFFYVFIYKTDGTYIGAIESIAYNVSRKYVYIENLVSGEYVYECFDPYVNAVKRYLPYFGTFTVQPNSERNNDENEFSGYDEKKNISCVVFPCSSTKNISSITTFKQTDIYSGEFFMFDVRDSSTNEQISNFEIKIYEETYPDVILETLNSRTITGAGNYRKYTNGTYGYTIKSDGYINFTGEFTIYRTSNELNDIFGIRLLAVNKENRNSERYGSILYGYVYDDDLIGSAHFWIKDSERNVLLIVIYDMDGNYIGWIHSIASNYVRAYASSDGAIHMNPEDLESGEYVYECFDISSVNETLYLPYFSTFTVQPNDEREEDMQEYNENNESLNGYCIVSTTEGFTDTFYLNDKLIFHIGAKNKYYSTDSVPDVSLSIKSPTSPGYTKLKTDENGDVFLNKLESGEYEYHSDGKRYVDEYGNEKSVIGISKSYFTVLDKNRTTDKICCKLENNKIYLYNGASNKPISGASLVVGESEYVSGSDGSISVKNINETGVVTFLCGCDYFDSTSVYNINIEGTNNVSECDVIFDKSYENLDFSYERNGEGDIILNIFDKSNSGIKISNAEVSIGSKTYYSDANGNVNVGNLSKGRYGITINKK